MVSVALGLSNQNDNLLTKHFIRLHDHVLNCFRPSLNHASFCLGLYRVKPSHIYFCLGLPLGLVTSSIIGLWCTTTLVAPPQLVLIGSYCTYFISYLSILLLIYINILISVICITWTRCFLVSNIIKILLLFK